MKLKKIASMILICCLLLGVLSGCGKQTAENPEPSASTEPAAAAPVRPVLHFAESYDEVSDAIKDAEAAREVKNSIYYGMNATAEFADANAAAAEGQGDGEGEGTFYSMTNVQVQGVDEGDIVKTDGTYLYILRDYELIIMKADNGAVTEVSHTIIGEAWDRVENEDGSAHTSQKQPTALYIRDDRAVILSDKYSWEEKGGTESGEDYIAVDILDISNPAAPQIVKTLGQDGYLIDSRMIGDKLFIATAYNVWDPDEKNNETFVPCLYTDGAKQPVECGTIGILPGGSSTTYSVLASYDVSAADLINSQSILGGGSMVYMNTENLYLADSQYNDTVTSETEEAPYIVTSHVSESTTTIHRFSVADGELTYAATGSVPGTLNNQFSMDEKDGNLRLVTNVQSETYQIYVDEANDFQNYKPGSTASSTSVYVLDSALSPVGSVTGIAEDEFVYSVRFSGDWSYLCTYRTVDPIFAVDLSDPAKPTVTGAVELPGYSDYLHIWEEGKLFGLGMQTQEVENDNGETIARMDGMKMVMIDTSDPSNLKELSTLEIDADYSEALYNHKAILVDHDRNLIAFPAEGSYLIYSYSPDSGFQLTKEIAVSEWDWQNRGLYIGSWFYVVGSDCVNVINLDTLENTAQVILSRG